MKLGGRGELFHNIALQCKQGLGDWHVVFIHAERKKKGLILEHNTYVRMSCKVHIKQT